MSRDVHDARRRSDSLFRLLALATFAGLLLTLAPLGVDQDASAQTSGGGTFNVGSYGTGVGTGGHFKRGYIFEVTQTTVVTGLTGAGTSGSTFAVGLYTVDTTSSITSNIYGDGSATPRALLGSIEFTGSEADGEDVTKPLASPVTLQPNTRYLLAQMRISPSGGSHATVTGLKIDDILTHPRIARWGPQLSSGPGVYYWSQANETDRASSFLDVASQTNQTLPRLGLQFESDCEPPAVTTGAVSITGTSITFNGTLTSTGAGGSACPSPAVELVFEYGPDENVGITGQRVDATPSSTTSTGQFTFTLSGLKPGQTYHYRAVAINEAARSDGDTLSFTFTPEPTVAAPTLIARDDTSLEVSADLQSIGTSSVTAHGFCSSAGGGPLTCSDLGTADAASTFSTTISGLDPGVAHTVYAYATNATGTTDSLTVTFTTLKADQTLEFAAVADRTFSTAPFTLSATAAPSGLTPTFASDTTSVCTVSGASVTMLSSGDCTITASQPGNSTFNAAPPVTRTFQITKAAQTITFTEPAARTYGDAPVTLTPTTSAVDLVPTLSTTDTAVCSVSGLTVTLVAAGDCTLTAAQGGDDRYLPATAVLRTVVVAKRTLSLSGTRVYDGTTDVPAVSLSATGLVGSEQLVLGGSASLPTSDAGIARSLTVTGTGTGITLEDGTNGGSAANYTLDGGIHTVTITQRPVRATFTVDGRVYDGTDDVDEALITSRTLVAVADDADSGTVAGDDVVLIGGTASLSSADVGTRTVTLSGAMLGGVRAANYEIHSTATTTATVTPRPLTVTGSFTVTDRTYDATDVAAIATDALALVGTIGSDAVSLAPVAAFDVATVGEDVPVRLIALSTLAGTHAANYALDLGGAPTATASILPRPLTVSGVFTVTDKVYDGTDVATVAGPGLTLTGLAPGDVLTDLAWTPSGRFTDATAGAARTVELIGGAVLGGPRGGDYVIDVDAVGTPTATATITQRPVTVTGASTTPRPYDGTTGITISGASLANTVAGDTVTLANATAGTAASRDAGTRAVATSMTLAGADAANYVLAGQPSLSVTITPLPVSVTMNALPSRPYDGATTLPLAAGAFTVSGTIPGESIAVSGTAQLSSRAAGTRTVALTTPTFSPGGGASLANYTLPSSITGTVTITPLTVRITGATVTQRAWDGTTVARITGATLVGARAGDAVSLAGATAGVFASAQPGTHTVAYSPTLVGVDASNYRLDVAQLTGTISRASATLRITGGLSQIADGSARQVRTAVSPATAGRIVVTYPGGRAPSAPGTYPVSVRLESATHDAPPVEATLTIRDLESLLFPGVIGAVGTSGSDATSGSTVQPGASDDPAVRADRMEQLMARMAVRPDGTLAMPEIGPVLERDGTAPALAPRDHRVMEDGEPSTARVTVVDQQRVRIERDDSGGSGFSIDLQASSDDASRTILPVDADGTLLLDRGGFVEVGGSGFLSGSTAEVWMFSTATFLGTAIVNADGTFEGSFPVDELLASGDHTIQLNGIGADAQVRSSSLGVRIDDPDAPSRERVVLATQSGGLTSGTSGWLLLLAALVGAGASRWWFAGRRHADDDEDGDAAHDGHEAEPRRPWTLTRG